MRFSRLPDMLRLRSILHASAFSPALLLDGWPRGRDRGVPGVCRTDLTPVRNEGNGESVESFIGRGC